MSLQDKVAVITGGAGVLCSSFGQALAQKGAKVALLDLEGGQAEEMAEQISANGGQAIGVTCNVLDESSVRQAAAIVKEKFGVADILINGAGGNQPAATVDEEFFQPNIPDNAQSFFSIPLCHYESVLSLNITGTILTTQVFGKQMAQRTGGCIVNISSVSADRSLTRVPAYSAAKAGVVNLTRWLAVYLAKSNIRVNALMPGFFAAKQNQQLLFSPDGTLSPRSKKILAHIPMERFCQVEELNGPLLFLCDNAASSYITGQSLVVDGGFVANSGI